MDEQDGAGRISWWCRCTGLARLAGLCLVALVPRRGTWLAAAAALATGVVVAVSLGDRLLGDPAHFSAARWRAGGLEVRGRMAADVCAGECLRGKTRAEVLDSLGEPDRDFRDVIEYDVLSPSPMAGRARWVAVRFDRTSGRVVEVTLQD